MNEAEKALQAAGNYLELGRYEQVLDALGPALTSPETAYLAYCLTSQSHALLGDPERSRQAAARALELDPQRDWAHYQMAGCLLELGQRAAALREARESVRLAPHSVRSQSQLATCLAAVCRYDEAREVAAAALTDHPGSPFTHYLEGRIADHVLSSRERPGDNAPWDAAENAYRRALALDPHDEAAALGLASVVRRRQRSFEALRIYLSVARANPANTNARIAIREMLSDAVDLQYQWWAAQPIEGWLGSEQLSSIGSASVAAELERIRVVLAQRCEVVDNAWNNSVKLLTDLARSLDEHFMSYGESSRPFSAFASRGSAESPAEVAHRLADSFQFATGQLGDHRNNLRKLTALGGELTMPTDEAAFHQVLIDIHPELDSLVDICRGCAAVLTEFSEQLWRFERDFATAMHWAQLAHEHQESAPEATEWEVERHEAIQLSHDLVDSFSDAETHCAASLRELVPPD